MKVPPENVYGVDEEAAPTDVLIREHEVGELAPPVGIT